MIDHVVLCRLEPDHDPEALQSVMSGLGELVVRLAGFKAFVHGPNLDVEGHSVGYQYGFRCQFTDRAAMSAYAADADHQRLGRALVTLCEGGADGLFIADIEHAT